MIIFNISVILYCSLVAGISLAEFEWNTFKNIHNKSYINNEDEHFRRNIFEAYLKKIKDHNRRFHLGLEQYKLGLNKLADLTTEEFLDHLKVTTLTGIRKLSSHFTKYKHWTLPKEIDYRTVGAVTHIKNEGVCGSCWCFSVAGAVEGQYFFRYNRLVNLSVQNLVDCVNAYASYGCQGGAIEDAFDYITDNGITTEEKYPYTAKQGKCTFTPHGPDEITNITGYTNIKSGSEEDLKAALVRVGPISVVVDATNFQLYSKGVFYDNSCSDNMLKVNHAMLVVGYGTTSEGIDFWIVKNSWGTSWGEDGYIRMSRNRNNQCGIATYASYPIFF